MQETRKNNTIEEKIRKMYEISADVEVLANSLNIKIEGLNAECSDGMWYDEAVDIVFHNDRIWKRIAKEEYDSYILLGYTESEAKQVYREKLEQLAEECDCFSRGSIWEHATDEEKENLFWHLKDELVHILDEEIYFVLYEVLLFNESTLDEDEKNEILSDLQTAVDKIKAKMNKI